MSFQLSSPDDNNVSGLLPVSVSAVVADTYDASDSKSSPDVGAIRRGMNGGLFNLVLNPSEMLARSLIKRRVDGVEDLSGEAVTPLITSILARLSLPAGEDIEWIILACMELNLVIGRRLILPRSTGERGSGGGDMVFAPNWYNCKPVEIDYGIHLPPRRVRNDKRTLCFEIRSMAFASKQPSCMRRAGNVVMMCTGSFPELLVMLFETFEWMYRTDGWENTELEIPPIDRLYFGFELPHPMKMCGYGWPSVSSTRSTVTLAHYLEQVMGRITYVQIGAEYWRGMAITMFRHLFTYVKASPATMFGSVKPLNNMGMLMSSRYGTMNLSAQGSALMHAMGDMVRGIVPGMLIPTCVKNAARLSCREGRVGIHHAMPSTSLLRYLSKALNLSEVKFVRAVPMAADSMSVLRVGVKGFKPHDVSVPVLTLVARYIIGDETMTGSETLLACNARREFRYECNSHPRREASDLLVIREKLVEMGAGAGPPTQLISQFMGCVPESVIHQFVILQVDTFMCNLDVAWVCGDTMRYVPIGPNMCEQFDFVYVTIDHPDRYNSFTVMPGWLAATIPSEVGALMCACLPHSGLMQLTDSIVDDYEARMGYMAGLGGALALDHRNVLGVGRSTYSHKIILEAIHQGVPRSLLLGMSGHMLGGLCMNGPAFCLYITEILVNSKTGKGIYWKGSSARGNVEGVFHTWDQYATAVSYFNFEVNTYRYEGTDVSQRSRCKFVDALICSHKELHL